MSSDKTGPIRALWRLSVVTAPADVEFIHPVDLQVALEEHAEMDHPCGIQDEEVSKANETWLETGASLRTLHRDRHGTRFWIETESPKTGVTRIRKDC